jgi:hypothetical protein
LLLLIPRRKESGRNSRATEISRRLQMRCSGAIPFAGLPGFEQGRSRNVSRSLEWSLKILASCEILYRLRARTINRNDGHRNHYELIERVSKRAVTFSLNYTYSCNCNGPIIQPYSVGNQSSRYESQDYDWECDRCHNNYVPYKFPASGWVGDAHANIILQGSECFC